MAYRILAPLAACVIGVCASSYAFAAPVTTDSCLAHGLCAYVSPTGSVTCGRCPGQVISVPLGANAVCKDGTFSILAATKAPLPANALVSGHYFERTAAMDEIEGIGWVKFLSGKAEEWKRLTDDAMEIYFPAAE